MQVFTLILILGLTFGFGYLNGLNSAGSIIATITSSRALKPRIALTLAIICMCLGPFIMGAAVVGTITNSLVKSNVVTPPVVVATLVGAIVWAGIAARLKLPCSTTHAFIGSLMGASVIAFGTNVIITAGIVKVMLALLLSPLLGSVVGFLMVKICYRISKYISATPSINQWFKHGQVLLGLLVALSFGSNDGQKLIGIVALGVMSIDNTQLVIPAWATVFSVLAIASGTLTGSQHVAKTLGQRLYKVQPIHGFGAQTASSLVILGASLFGSPISGSQVITSAIVGAGGAERMQMVRWGIIRQIFATWVLTLPSSAVVGAIIYMVCKSMNL